MSVLGIGVGTTFSPPIKLSTWSTSASTNPTRPVRGLLKRPMKVVGSSGVVTRKIWPSVPSSGPTTVQVVGRAQKVWSAERPAVVRTITLVSAFAGVAQNRASNAPAIHIRCFTGWPSFLAGDDIPAARHAPSQFLSSPFLFSFSGRSDFYALISPPNPPPRPRLLIL